MKVQALSPFTAFTGEMVVFNTGDVRDIPEAVAKQYIEAGLAKKTSSKETEVAPAVDDPNPTAGDAADAGGEAGEDNPSTYPAADAAP